MNAPHRAPMGRLAALAATLALVGCIGGRPPEDFRTPPYRAPDAALVAIDRPATLVSFAAVVVVTLDGAPMAQLGNGQQADFRAPPGQHVLGLECNGGADVILGRTGQLVLDLEPGRRYRVEALLSGADDCQLLIRSIN